VNCLNNNKSNRLNDREKILIVTLLTAIALCGFWQLGGLAYLAEIASLRTKEKATRLEILSLEELITDQREIENNWLDNKEKVALYRQILPSLADQPEALGNLENLLKSSAADLTNLQINEMICHDRFCELSGLAVLSGEQDLLKIIEDLESLSQLTLLDYLKWQAEDADYETLELSFRLIFMN
jgi:Tfp pilus assembly protein PilO